VPGRASSRYATTLSGVRLSSVSSWPLPQRLGGKRISWTRFGAKREY
jgi:hypothetical protein